MLSHQSNRSALFHCWDLEGVKDKTVCGISLPVYRSRSSVSQTTHPNRHKEVSRIKNWELLWTLLNRFLLELDLMSLFLGLEGNVPHCFPRLKQFSVEWHPVDDHNCKQVPEVLFFNNQKKEKNDVYEKSDVNNVFCILSDNSKTVSVKKSIPVQYQITMALTMQVELFTQWYF